MKGPESPGGQLLDRLNALSDASRLRMLALLDRFELGVGELATALQLPQSTASRHLRRLHDAGWVARRSEGVHARYRLATDTLDNAADDLWQAASSTFKRDVQATEDQQRAEQVIAARHVDSKAFFGAVGGTWTELRDSLFGQAAATEALLALLAPTTTVADLGCGTGFLASQLAPWVARIDAVDREASMLDAARKRLAAYDNICFHQGNVIDVPLPDQSVDMALALLLLHHIDDPLLVVQQAARILRPGGRLLIVDMTKHDRNEYRDTMGHVHLGFEEQDVSAWAGSSGMVLARFRRLHLNPQARGPGLFAAMLQLQ